MGCTSRSADAEVRRHVIKVEQRLPAPLLRRSLRLIDTPGLDEADADELYTRRTLLEDAAPAEVEGDLGGVDDDLVEGTIRHATAAIQDQLETAVLQAGHRAGRAGGCP